jgi:hypothetical protein
MTHSRIESRHDHFPKAKDRAVVFASKARLDRLGVWVSLTGYMARKTSWDSHMEPFLLFS